MQVETSHSLAPRRIFSLFAFLGFGLSLVVHLLSFSGLNLSERVPWIWVLHVAIFVFFIPLVLSKANRGSRSGFWRRFFAPMPKWTRFLVSSLFCYALINFIIFFALTQDGSPAIRDGRYVLRNGGNVIREISKQEYDLRNDRIIRGFSGHWMVFYIGPALYFWFPRNEEEEEGS